MFKCDYQTLLFLTQNQFVYCPHAFSTILENSGFIDAPPTRKPSISFCSIKFNELAPLTDPP